MATLRHARQHGVNVNATAVGIEDLTVEDTPVALHNEYPNDWRWWGGVVALVGGRFRGGSPNHPAITNTMVVESCDLRVVGAGGGDIFVTECPSHLELRSPCQSCWARQLNPEGDSDVGLVLNHGGRLWTLGVKHEGRGVRFLTDRGGHTEILGLFNYAPDIAADDPRPAFDVVEADFSAAGVRETSFGNIYPVKVREARGADVRTEQGGGWIGWALYRSGFPAAGPQRDAR